MLSFRSASDKHLTICGALLALFLLLIFGGVRVWLSAHEGIDPLPPHLFEAFLGCEESALVEEALRPLAAKSRSVHSATFRRTWNHTKEPTLRRAVRIQIVDGVLYASCLRGGRECFSKAFHELRTLSMLLDVERLADTDFFFDGDERPCVHARGRVVPLFTHETAPGCANVLVPARALDVLPDGARWLSRALVGPWDWSRRQNRAVWRGKATDDAGMRRRAVLLSRRRPDLLDATFSERGGTGVPAAAAAALPRGAANASAYLTWEEAQAYRATLVLDGATLADRLPFLLFSGAAVLKQASPLREGFYRYLEPYVNFVPVAADLSDLEAQLEWALANTSRLRAIADAGAALAMRHLSRRAQLCHWSQLLGAYGRLLRGPVVLDPHAVRVPRAAPVREPLSTWVYNPLRPQLSHVPPRLSDLGSLWKMHPTPCVPGLSLRHWCVDL